MRRKGFTLVELLVVIAIIALLMGILMPALARVRQLAFRLVCGTNLSGIGKAMLLYSADYDDEYPRAGGPQSVWARYVRNWQATDRFGAYGVASDGSSGQATITSCLYLLVKYSEVTPKSFLCKGDSSVTEFKPSDYNVGDRDPLTLWDFGPNNEPEKHVSYSYHHPFGVYALTTASDPGMAVLGDRNPWITNEAAESRTTWTAFNPIGGKEAIKLGNSMSHQEDGQNILFMDGHVSFEDKPSCGVNDDNVYTVAATGEVEKGIQPVLAGGNVKPADRTDSFLVQDGEGLPNTPGPRRP